MANITFDGSRYLGGVASDFSIHATDLSAAGEASEVRAAVKGRTVFMLSGVDEGDAVVMEPADPSADYYIFFREGVGTPGVPMSSVIEGLCRYLDEPPADCG